MKHTSRAAKCRNTLVDNSDEARKAYNRHDGGPQPEEPDVLPEELETRRKQFYKTLVNVSAERAHEIEKSTQTQAADPDGLWQKEQRIRVTSSTAGKL